MKALTIGGLTAATAAAFAVAAWGAPAKPAKKPGAPATAPATAAAPEPMVDPGKIWQANLERIAGRYTFAQVASPGGLWQTFEPAGGGKAEMQQISLSQAPAALREKLLAAEVVISDLKTPRKVEAAERLSPSKRGMLRYYEERGAGNVTVRNLPGISGDDAQTDYSGPVLLTIEHQNHSNPSVSGILSQRQQQESTWGAATIDFASLTASSVPKDENEEGVSVITNARILRSGVEIFAFVEWQEKDATGSRRIIGSVRLVRQPDAAGKPAAARGTQ
ncbi:MAG: hypothetical protein K0Q72_4201 [Armatimonadetes bacterium]|nr:hypothetical protein [Armatimonadota bacterium]